MSWHLRLAAYPAGQNLMYCIRYRARHAQILATQSFKVGKARSLLHFPKARMFTQSVRLHYPRPCRVQHVPVGRVVGG